MDSIDKAVLLKSAIDEAARALKRGGPLPAYLEKALMRYNEAFWRRVDREVIAPKLVDSYASAGLPLSRKSPRKNAFEAVEEQLGLSAGTAERVWRAKKKRSSTKAK